MVVNGLLYGSVCEPALHQDFKVDLTFASNQLKLLGMYWLVDLTFSMVFLALAQCRDSIHC